MRAARWARRSSGGASTSSSGPTAGWPRSSTTATSRPGSGRSGPRKRSARARDNPNRGARARFRRALATAWRRHSGERTQAPPPRHPLRPRAPRGVPARVPVRRRGAGPRLGMGGRGPSHADRRRRRSSPPTAARWTSCCGTTRRSISTSFPPRGALLESSVLWLNDPRAVVAQAKSAFAALWTLLRDGRWLTRTEAALVERLVPPTGLASQIGWLDRARARPEDWVLKPVLGRYSERVDAGSARPRGGMAGRARPPPPRAQMIGSSRPSCRRADAGCPLPAARPSGLRQLGRLPRRRPARRPVPALPAHSAHRRRPRVVGATCSALRASRGTEGARARWPTRVVTTWAGMAGDRRPPARSAATPIAWTDGLANFTLAAIALTPGAWDELRHATLVLGPAVGRVLAHLRHHPELLGVLGIPEPLAPLCASDAEGRRAGAFSRASTGRGRPTGAGSFSRSTATRPPDSGRRASIEGEVARLHPAAAPPSRGFWPALAASWRRGVERCARPGRRALAGSGSDSSGRSALPRTPTSCAPTPRAARSPCLARIL